MAFNKLSINFGSGGKRVLMR
ncbi:hypothetical protein ACLKA6_011954, partial [Drosophila palustris]